MAIHDYNIANQTFPATRSDINDVLAAIVTNNSNATAPTTTFAYMWWYDTANNILKQRNGANNAWINIGTYDQTNGLFFPAFTATTSAKTGAYTVVLADRNSVILGDATSAAFTVTLPAAATAGAGFMVTVKKTDSSANAVTVDANASETIDGALTFALTAQYDAVNLICNGSAWFILNREKTFTSTERGLVPASGGGTANFLRADGTWTAIATPTQDYEIIQDWVSISSGSLDTGNLTSLADYSHFAIEFDGITSSTNDTYPVMQPRIANSVISSGLRYSVITTSSGGVSGDGTARSIGAGNIPMIGTTAASYKVSNTSGRGLSGRIFFESHNGSNNKRWNFDINHSDTTAYCAYSWGAGGVVNTGIVTGVVVFWAAGAFSAGRWRLVGYK